MFHCKPSLHNEVSKCTEERFWRNFFFSFLCSYTQSTFHFTIRGLWVYLHTYTYTIHMSNVSNNPIVLHMIPIYTKILLRCYLLSENDIDNEHKIFFFGERKKGNAYQFDVLLLFLLLFPIIKWMRPPRQEKINDKRKAW